MSENVHEIEAEIAVTRARLNDTLGRIQDKLTVTGIVDEVMLQAGIPRAETGHDFLLALMRRHPVPVMIAAAGLGYLIYRQNRRARDAALRQIEDGDYAEVPVEPTVRARAYDPDTAGAGSGPEEALSRRSIAAQA